MADNYKGFHFGLLPRTVAYGEVSPIYSEVMPVIPRDQWQDFTLSHYIPRILDQDGQGSCVAASGVASVMLCRVQTGLKDVELSIGSLYGQINDGVDGGSTLDRSITALTKVGCCPVSLIPHYEWHPSRWPRNWKEEAKKYRITESYDCTNFDEICSAILSGFAVSYGIPVTRGFVEDVSKDGFVPEKVVNVVGLHALLGVGLKQHNGQWWIETQNSWGEKWGKSGTCYVPESYFKTRYGVDAWAIRVTTFSAKDNQNGNKEVRVRKRRKAS